MSLDTRNKLILLPLCLDPIGKGIIVTKTAQYTKRTIGKSKLILPQGYDQEVERKFDIGEVLSVGNDVTDVCVGDIVVYQISTAFRIPNGIDKPICWKVEEFSMSIIAVLPNLYADKRAAKWDAKPGLDDELVPYQEMLKEVLAGGDDHRNIPSDVIIPAIHGGEIERPDISTVIAPDGGGD